MQRITIDYSANESDRYWALFKRGKLDRPIALLSDAEAERLFARYQEQAGTPKKKGAKN